MYNLGYGYGGGMTNLLHDPVRPNMQTYIAGTNRLKYYKAPLVPTIQERDPNEARVQELPQEDEDEQIIEEEPASKEMGCQSKYRDSEAQTIPYTPKYTVLDNENLPEVLSLKHMTFGNGLPATMDEMEYIQLQREKNYFENALPPTSDEASFLLRRKLMEEQEFKEWNKRETEIKKIQNDQLNLLQSALREREKDIEEKNQRRIEEIKIRATEHKNRLIAKIQRRKIKVLRKVIKSRKQTMDPTLRREIIDDYNNFASKVYAGITREGLSLDKLANKYEVQPLNLTNYHEIEELRQTLPPSILKTNISAEKFMDDIKKTYSKQEKDHKKAIQNAVSKISDTKKKDVEKKEEVRKENKIQARPNTPMIHRYDSIKSQVHRENEIAANIVSQFQGGSNDNNKNKEQQKQKKIIYQIREKAQQYQNKEKAVIFFQRLLRGRAIQNEMFVGKEKRLALIEELLNVNSTQLLTPEQQAEVLNKNHEEITKDAMLEAIQGDIITKTLDLLAKELIRFKQQKHIFKLVEKAMVERRKREIIEQGQRQAELQLREREQNMYNNIKRTHQGTVDSYLSYLMKNTIDKCSSKRAEILTNELKKDLKEAKKLDEREKNILNKQLLKQFLIPNIQRNKIKKQIALEEKRYVETAKHAMNYTVKHLAKMVNKKK